MALAYAETPSGTINSSNVTFTLANTPNPAPSLQLFLNGLLQKSGGVDFTLSGLTLTFTVAPLTNDTLLAYYQFGPTSSNSLSTVTLQSTANFFSIQADLLPLTGIGGFSNEPFLTIANDALSDLISDPSDWKFNRKVAPLIVTCPSKQDYQWAGACAFSLGSTAQGWAIDLYSNNAITTTAGVVTVNTIEPHRFAVGDVVYLNNVTMTTGSTSKYNSTFTDNGTSSAWSGGFTIASVSALSFTFTALAGQNNGDVGGAPGIFDFAYGTSASMVQMVDTSSPQGVRELSVRREMPVSSRITDPTKISVINDAGNGVLTVRFYLVPGTTMWGATLVYQQKAPVKVAMTDTWSPFPDHLSSVYRQAVLYRMREFQNSPSAQVEWQKLQTMRTRALGFGEAEHTDVSLKPEEPIMDDSLGTFYFN